MSRSTISVEDARDVKILGFDSAAEYRDWLESNEGRDPFDRDTTEPYEP